MRFTHKLFLAAAIGSASLSAQAVDLSAVPSGTYASDPVHAYVSFQYTHLGLSRPMLQFDDFSVTVDLDNTDVSKSTIAVTIDPKSIQAGSDIWKSHLTGDNWFDVGSYPEITFNSTAIEDTGADTFKVTGNLTIKDKTAPAVLDVTLHAAKAHPFTGDPIIGFSAEGQVLRSAFGLGKNAPAVSDEIDLMITVEAKPAE